jgi:hypothetical protein
MKRKMPVLLLALLVAVSGQAAGIKPGLMAWAGGTISRYEGKPTPAGIPETNYKHSWRTGLNLGLGLALKLTRIPLDFRLGLGYLEKGTKLDVYSLDTKMGSYPYRLNTLSQTGLARTSFSGKWTPYLLAGYELAFILKHRGQPFGLGGPDLKPDTKKLDFCLVVGTGLEFKGQKMSPFVEVRYHHGLVNLSRGSGSLEYYQSIKSRVLVLGAGLNFGKS